MAEFASDGDHWNAHRPDRRARAGTNKQLIYAYFGSKQELFDWVVTDQVVEGRDDRIGGVAAAAAPTSSATPIESKRSAE